MVRTLSSVFRPIYLICPVLISFDEERGKGKRRRAYVGLPELVELLFEVDHRWLLGVELATL